MDYLCTFAIFFLLAMAAVFVYGLLNLRFMCFQHRRLKGANDHTEPRAAILLEHYQEHPEWATRIRAAKDLYETAKERCCDFRIILAVGEIKAYGRGAMAYRDKEELMEAGIPRKAVEVYLGKKKKGGVETLGEVRLACACVKTWGQDSAYVIANPLQMPLAIFACIWNGVWPRPVAVHLEETRLFYFIGKGLQLATFIFDPYGMNPLSLWIKYKRRKGS